MVIYYYFTNSGYLCGLYRRNQDQTLKSSAKKLTPVYEAVLPKDHEQLLELKTNISYAPVQNVMPLDLHVIYSISFAC